MMVFATVFRICTYMDHTTRKHACGLARAAPRAPAPWSGRTGADRGGRGRRQRQAARHAMGVGRGTPWRVGCGARTTVDAARGTQVEPDENDKRRVRHICNSNSLQCRHVEVRLY